MARKIATQQEIAAEIQRRIETSDERDGDCRGCEAPTPTPLIEPDASGCNWTVMVLPRMIPGCTEYVQRIVREVMHEYNISD